MARPCIFAGLLILLLCGLPFCAGQARTATKTASADTVTLVDGEQLSGKLVNILSGKVVFHSDVLGDVSFPLAKIKSLHAGQFAVIVKGRKITRKSAAKEIPVGAIAIENATVRVTPPQAQVKVVSATDAPTVIDAASFHQVLAGKNGLLHGWNGAVTLGASLVKSTNSAQTYTGAISVIRAAPTVSWLPPVSKITLNLSGAYGLARDPEIEVNSVLVQPASITKTDILQGGLEYDRYWSPALFGYGAASATHNLGSGLLLQQSYGGGIGWTVLNHPTNNLALKAAMQYEQQQFYSAAGAPLTPNKNLTAAAVNETWTHGFAHNFKLNQDLTLTPAFNAKQAYSGVADAGLIFPAYKRLNFALTSTDNYIGDPPAGYMRNTFQFTAGINYTLK